MFLKRPKAAATDRIEKILAKAIILDRLAEVRHHFPFVERPLGGEFQPVVGLPDAPQLFRDFGLPLGIVVVNVITVD